LNLIHGCELASLRARFLFGLTHPSLSVDFIFHAGKIERVVILGLPVTEVALLVHQPEDTIKEG
jgi:hypothetical protein